MKLPHVSLPPPQVLLGGGELQGAPDQRHCAVRLRVPGQHSALGDHTPDRPLLPHSDRRLPPPPEWSSRGTGRHGEDRNHQGPGQGAGRPVHRVQLLRWIRLHRYGEGKDGW